jgi:hypothetical protein
MSVGANDNTRDIQTPVIKKLYFLIEYILLCFNYHNKTISSLRQKHNNIQFLTPYCDHKKVSGIISVVFSK